MTNRRTFLMMSFGAALAATGCTTDQTVAGPVARVGFDHLAPIALNVGQIDVQTAFRSTMKAPNVEFRMPTPPAKALADWAAARLQAMPGAGAKATFVIEDAQVLEVIQEKTEGIKGFFTTEATDQYTAKIAARFRVEDPSGAGGEVTARAERFIDILEDSTLEEREQRWVELVEALMADFDAEMDKQIRTHLGHWLR